MIVRSKNMHMITALLVILLLFAAPGAVADGPLPSWTDLMGTALPSIGEALQRYPDSETSNEDGTITYLYQEISNKDYEAFSVYLGQRDAEMIDSKLESGVLTAKLRANVADFSFVYDINSREAKVTYPDGTYDQWIYNAENHLAIVKELQEKGNTGETAAEVLCIPQYMNYGPLNEYLQKNPDLSAAVVEREEKIAAYRTPWSLVTFGKYEQDNNL